MHLTALAHHHTDGNSALAAHPTLRPYLTDLAATRGLALREDVLGTGQAYAELAAPAVDAVTSDDEPVDLLVLAYAIPDVQPGRNTALHLADRCPGNPLAFAICDQGQAAAFTALRLIAAHDARRAVLVVAEQAAVPYPLAAPAPVPGRHSAVAVLFEKGPAPITVRTHADLPPEAVDAVLTADLAELSGARADVTVVSRSDVDGLPHTGLWARLANKRGPLVLADYDPALRYLCVAALVADPRPLAGSPGRGGGGVVMAVKD